MAVIATVLVEMEMSSFVADNELQSHRVGDGVVSRGPGSRETNLAKPRELIKTYPASTGINYYLIIKLYPDVCKLGLGF